MKSYFLWQFCLLIYQPPLRYPWEILKSVFEVKKRREKRVSVCCACTHECVNERKREIERQRKRQVWKGNYLIMNRNITFLSLSLSTYLLSFSCPIPSLSYSSFTSSLSLSTLPLSLSRPLSSLSLSLSLVFSLFHPFQSPAFDFFLFKSCL